MINDYNWEGKSHQWKSEDWKRFDKNNPAIPLKVLYIKEKEIRPIFISHHNSNYDERILLLMIPNEEKKSWYYLSVKKISALSPW